MDSPSPVACCIQCTLHSRVATGLEIIGKYQLFSVVGNVKNLSEVEKFVENKKQQMSSDWEGSLTTHVALHFINGPEGEAVWIA